MKKKVKRKVVKKKSRRVSRYMSYTNGTHEVLNRFINEGESKSKNEAPPVADLMSKFNELNYRLMKLNDFHEANLNKLNTLL